MPVGAMLCQKNEILSWIGFSFGADKTMLGGMKSPWTFVFLSPTALYSVLLMCSIGLGVAAQNGPATFSDPFQQEIKDGWSWIREHSGAWRMTPRALEIKVEPGNMWGGANDAKNILMRDLPDAAGDKWTVSATFHNQPTEQYEQVDLVWYYNDSYQVKIGQELVDGQLSIVMGREENDRTKTIAIIPLDSFEVSVKFEVDGDVIRGSFRKKGSKDWIVAGETDLPVHGKPHITIQCYQGPSDQERWARIRDFELRSIP
jgi:regulation of enolase protein 1 (concanavalin A-like superfamily)